MKNLSMFTWPLACTWTHKVRKVIYIPIQKAKTSYNSRKNIYTCMYIHAIYTCIHIYIYTQPYIHISTYTHMHTHVHISIYRYIYIYVHIHVNVYIYTHICICIYICVHMYRQYFCHFGGAAHRSEPSAGSEVCSGRMLVYSIYSYYILYTRAGLAYALYHILCYYTLCYCIPQNMYHITE